MSPCSRRQIEARKASVWLESWKTRFFSRRSLTPSVTALEASGIIHIRVDLDGFVRFLLRKFPEWSSSQEVLARNTVSFRLVKLALVQRRLSLIHEVIDAPTLAAASPAGERTA